MYVPPQEKATYITIATPFIGLGITCCMNPARSFREVQPSEIIAQLVIYAVFALFGLGCGMYGAFTFGDHGSYGILIGCILGILLNGALLALVVLAVVGGLAMS